jgi:hypothetical protein
VSVDAIKGLPDADSEAPGGLALWLLLGCAVGLRLIGLGGDLWHDELFTWLDLLKLPLLELWSSYPDDNQHLVYSLAGRVSILLFGENPEAIRLPALLFGVGSLWATYRLGVGFFPRREVLFAVALLAFSYHHVWFSQNARGYTALLFATVFATDLLLRAWRSDTPRAWLGYAAVLALGMGAHLTMIFVALAHGLVVLGLLVRSDTRKLAFHSLAGLSLGGVLTLLLFAPALPAMFDFYLQPSAGATTADVEWKNPLWLANETIRSFGVPLAVGWIAALVAAIPFAVGGIDLLRRSPVAALLFALPALTGFLAMLLLERNLWPRFFFNSFGFIVLVGFSGVALMARWIGQRIGAAQALPLAALAFVVTASAVTVPRNYALPKQDYTGAREWVTAQAKDGDAIVALDLAADAFGRHYAPEFGTADTLVELQAVASPRGHTYVLYTFGGYIEARQPSLWRVLRDDFEEVEAFHGTLGGGAIIVRRTKARGALATER